MKKWYFLIFFSCALFLCGLRLGTISISRDAAVEQKNADESNGGLNGQPQTLTPIDSPTLPAREFFMGVLPSASTVQTDLDIVYQQVADYAEFVPIWGKPSPFYELADDISSSWGDIFIDQLIRDKGMFPLINLSFIGAGMTLATPASLPSATLSTTEWRELYKQSAIDVVTAARPLYFSVGNEVNRWYEKYGSSDTPNAFEHFVSLYEEIYDEVKTISPQTKVYCIFAREIVGENREASLDFLNMFDPDKLDLIVLTSYPYSVQGTTSTAKIPDDYYSKVVSSISATGKPFGFSELAWVVNSFFGGEQGQADFINDLSSRLTVDQGLDLHLFGWFVLHDLAAGNPVGLISLGGTERISYQTWKTLSGK
jgi:hypothetical protein